MSILPCISVVVPVYNVEPYLRRCLNSLLHQTQDNIEIICVDDGSTDESYSILKEYESQNSQIIVLTQKNAGPAAARNAALAVARAPYIMFCDADDYYENGMCESMLNTIGASDNIDIAVCGVDIIYEANAEMQKGDAKYFHSTERKVESISDEILSNLDICLWNKIFRRDNILKWGVRFPEGVMYEDVYFSSIYAMRSSHIAFVPDKLYHYTRRADSTMGLTFSGRASFYVDHLSVAFAIYDYLKEQHMLQRWFHQFGRILFRQIDTALNYSKSQEVKQQIFECAEDFLKKNNLCFSQYEELAYNQYRVINKLQVGDIRKKWCGILKIKQKAQYAKIYLFGVYVRKSKSMSVPHSL